MAFFEVESLSPRYMQLGFSKGRTVRETLESLRDDAAFREAWNEGLAEIPFRTYRWETPRTTLANLDAPFEAVVVDAPTLDRNQSWAAFDEHGTSAPVITVPNLRGDALLVVPTPQSEEHCYCHLARFVRAAPAQQRDAFWHAVADAVLERVQTRPVWLSTAGGGVPWLHVRLDDRPKYYAYAPYREVPGEP